MSYSLDGQEQIPVDVEVQDWDPFGFNQTVALTLLTNGSHSITVHGTYCGYTTQVTVSFTVVTIDPTISFLTSAQNKTYDKSNVTFGYVVNKPVSKIIYCLDNHANANHQ
jgi:hypothetical protein